MSLNGLDSASLWQTTPHSRGRNGRKRTRSLTSFSLNAELSALDAPISEPGPTYGKKPFALATLDLDQGTEREAEFRVRNPDYSYRPRVTKWGTISRALSGPPPTLPIIGNFSIDIAETDSYYRRLLNITTQRRRPITTKIGFEGGREQDFPTLYVGQMGHGKFTPGGMNLSCWDRWKEWMERQVPNWINPVNCPNLPTGTTSGFWPLVLGRVESFGANPQGVITLPLIDTVSNLYALNRTVTKEVIRVTRTLPGEEVFTIVDPAEYQKVEDDKTIDGYVYRVAYLQFFVAQPEGTIIRADVDGTSFRGQFGTLEEISGQSIRNAADHIIGLLFYLFVLEPNSSLAYDIWSFYNTWKKLHDLNLYSDIAFTENTTFGEMIGQICYSQIMDFYQNKFGQIAINFNTLGEQFPDRIVLDDTFDILESGQLEGDKSELRFMIEDLERIINQLEYHYGWMNSDGQWGAADFYNNTADQAELGRIQPDVFEFRAIRDQATMEYVIQLLASAFAIRTKRITMWVSGPKNIGRVELAQAIGITVWDGYGGPWVNQQAKIYGLDYDAERHELKIVAYALVTPTEVEAEPGACAGANLSLPLQGTGGNEFYADYGIDTIAWGTAVPINNIASLGLTSAKWEILARNVDPDFTKTVDIVDENGVVYDTITVPINTNDYTLFQGTFTPAAGDHRYMMKIRAITLADNLVFVVEQFRVWLNINDAMAFQPQIQLLNEDDGSTGFSGDAEENSDFGYQAEFALAFLTTGYTSAGKTFPRWVKESGKWPSGISWTFEVIAAVLFRDGTDTLYASLYNETTGLMVAGTEITITNQHAEDGRQVVSFSDSATNFTSGDRFAPRFKRNTYNSAVDIMVAYQANLYPVIDSTAEGVTCGCKSQVAIVVASFGASDCPVPHDKAYITGYKTLLDVPQFSDPTVWYFEVTAKSMGGAPTGAAYLHDHGTSPTGYSTSDPIVATLGPFSNTDFEPLRVAFTPIPGHYYFVSYSEGLAGDLLIGFPSYFLAESSCPE